MELVLVPVTPMSLYPVGYVGKLELTKRLLVLKLNRLRLKTDPNNYKDPSIFLLLLCRNCAGMQTLMVGTSELSLTSNPFLVEMR